MAILGQMPPYAPGFTPAPSGPLASYATDPRPGDLAAFDIAAPPSRGITPAPTFQILGAPPAPPAQPMDLAALEYARPGERVAAPAPLARIPLGQALAQFGIGAQPPAPAAAPAATPTAAPQTEAAPAPAAAPQAAPRGAQAPRAAGPAKLSEIGQIQEGVAGARLATASEALDTAIGRLGTMEAATEEAQRAESAAAAERADLAGQEAMLARQREEEAATEREQRRQAAEETTAKLEAAQTELDGTKIDIDKAYGGAAGRIFAGLAVALGSARP